MPQTVGSVLLEYMVFTLFLSAIAVFLSEAFFSIE